MKNLPDPFAALRTRVHEPSISPAGTPAPLVEGGYGRVRSAESEVDTTRRVPVKRVTERDARNLMNAEILQALRSLVESTTQLSSQINRRGSLNGVIGVSKVIIGSSGMATIQRPVTIGTAVIYNGGSNMLTISLGGGSPSEGVPTRGVGLFPVASGAFLPVPISQKAFVIYGTEGDVVGVQLFTGLQGYGASL